MPDACVRGTSGPRLRELSPASRDRIRIRIRRTPHGQSAAVALIPPVAANPTDWQERVSAAWTRPRAPANDERHENDECNPPKRLTARCVAARVEPEARDESHRDDAADDGPTSDTVIPPLRTVVVRRGHREATAASRCSSSPSAKTYRLTASAAAQRAFADRLST